MRARGTTDFYSVQQLVADSEAAEVDALSIKLFVAIVAVVAIIPTIAFLRGMTKQKFATCTPASP